MSSRCLFSIFVKESYRFIQVYERSNPAFDCNAYLIFSLTVWSEVYSGSLSKFIHVDAVGSLTFPSALWMQNGGTRWANLTSSNGALGVDVTNCNIFDWSSADSSSMTDQNY